MAVPIYVVDAFTSRPFAGNPAGVCILEKAADPEWMQGVAAEMKHAETAFVSPRADGFDLRWFTPATEVDLCGHATLASAHVLWETDRLSVDAPANFHTRSGLLECTRHGYGIQMDFPAEPVDPARQVDAQAILSALGVSGDVAGAKANRMDVLVEVENEGAVRAMEPDLEALMKINARGVIVTSRSDSDDYDFVSRFFAPAAGVPEDSVTGSAHCCLGPYWAEKLGKIDLVGFQCSPRGGVVRVAVRDGRVLLQGHAITTLAGEFLA
jgi:PhzF family phenazine biosynthesis protein